MVARLFRLRIALAGGVFRGSFARGLRAAFLLLLSFAAAIAAAYAPTLLFEPGELRIAFDLVLGVLALSVALLVPFFDNRRNLVPRQFAQYPVRSGSLSFALVISTVASWPFLVLLAWLVTLGVTRPEWHSVGWIAPLVLVLIAVSMLVGVRLSSGVSQLLMGGRYAGGLRFLGGLLGVASLPLFIFAITETVRSESNSLLFDAAGPFAWTPFGAGFAAIAEVNAGNMETGALRLAVLGGAAIVGLLLWILVVHISVRRVERPLDVSSARQGLGWFERFAARPSQVIAARQVTYWIRDPRYRVALLALPVAPIAILIAFLVAGAEPRLVAAIPLPILLLLLGWSQHNDIAMDSTAIWEHVASGVRGWADRMGRLAPVLILGVPLAVIGSSLTATFMGDWRILPAIVGMNLGVLFVATGVASTFSALMPYPATRPGDSPFVQPQWSGSGSGMSQTLSMLAALTFAVPPVWLAVLAINDVSFIENVWALVFGVGYGLMVLFGGVWVGGRIFDKQGPEILAVTQIFD